MNVEKTPGFKERLRTIAQKTVQVFRDIGEAFEAPPEEEPRIEKPSGWLDPDDDAIQYQHNGVIHKGQ